jgi:hypothetical protein
MTLLSAAAVAAWASANVAGYWRYRAALAEPERTQQAILMHYLRENADTVFGRAHGFSGIRSVDEYQARVPLASYSDFAPSIDDISAGRQGATASEVSDYPAGRFLRLSGFPTPGSCSESFAAPLRRGSWTCIAPVLS